MGLSKLDLMIIQTRGSDVKCDYGGPSTKNGKYVAWITLYNRNGEYDHPILNTDAIFDSAKQALAWAKKFVKVVRSLPEIKFSDLIPPEDLAVVQKIIEAAFG